MVDKILENSTVRLTTAITMLVSVIGGVTWMLLNQSNVEKQIIKLRADTDVGLSKIDGKLDAFIAAGPRYTAKDARVDHLEWKAGIMKDISEQYPPQWLRGLVEELESRVDTLEKGG